MALVLFGVRRRLDRANNDIRRAEVFNLFLRFLADALADSEKPDYARNADKNTQHSQ